MKNRAHSVPGLIAITPHLGYFMPHISILPPDQASKASKDVYDEFYRRMQFPAPPNFIMTQDHSSYVARGT
jgi:hypothetical protein